MFEVNELFAFIAIDEDGNEGVMAAVLDGSLFPLVCADLARLQLYVPLADATGADYQVKHFQLIGEVGDDYLKQFRKDNDNDN